MVWDENKTVYTLWGYKPVTKPAIQWIRCTDGNYYATDRGTDEDVFESNIVFKGPESEMITLAGILDAKRTVFAVNCGTGEEIFGADIDYSDTLVVTVVKYGKMKRASFGQYAMPITLRLRNPSFTGSASLADLRLSQWDYEGDSTYDMTKIFSYNDSARYLRSWVDVGLFRATFKQTFDEMKAIRRYLLTTARTAAVSFPTQCGIPYPFGYRMGSGPFTCKIIKWDDLGRPELDTANISIQFAREIT